MPDASRTWPAMLPVSRTGVAASAVEAAAAPSSPAMQNAAILGPLCITRPLFYDPHHPSPDQRADESHLWNLLYSKARRRGNDLFGDLILDLHAQRVLSGLETFQRKQFL